MRSQRAAGQKLHTASAGREVVCRQMPSQAALGSRRARRRADPLSLDLRCDAASVRRNQTRARFGDDLPGGRGLRHCRENDGRDHDLRHEDALLLAVVVAALVDREGEPRTRPRCFDRSKFAAKDILATEQSRPTGSSPSKRSELHRTSTPKATVIWPPISPSTFAERKGYLPRFERAAPGGNPVAIGL
jgi:hypothetical protein